jgi:hypothetical protein
MNLKTQLSTKVTKKHENIQMHIACYLPPIR